MNQRLSLAGTWEFLLDNEKQGLKQHYEKQPFPDTIDLPNTTAAAKKGMPNTARETSYLTETYKTEGYAWYRKVLSLPFDSEEDLNGLHFRLRMERTRISRVWVDGVFVGSFDSFMVPHVYDLTEYIHSLQPAITIMISNTDYIVPGGHMTSPDTQTNWNGILGRIDLSWDSGIRIGTASSVSDPAHHALKLTIPIENDTTLPKEVQLKISGELLILHPEYKQTLSDSTGRRGDSDFSPAACTSEEMLLDTICQKTDSLPEQSRVFTIPVGGLVTEFDYDLSGHEALWSEYRPNIYALCMELSDSEPFYRSLMFTGQKSFTADGGFFAINGRRTFLRGKHDGMVFPLTGYAPMSVEGWLAVMYTAKTFGINHYRFHTCCPPEAAFFAADLLGIYLQPELPFWGTFHGPDEEDYNEEAQLFLRQEGFRMLSAFSSHPSYCMMSMGNELWGNPAAIDALLAEYKVFRPHILYTQGSNNFQWTPNIGPHDDFFSGVRFTLDRRIRGSYAMCDKPLGHVQTDAPGTRFCYEDAIHPAYQTNETGLSEDGTIEIQYGTGVKRVKLTELQEELNPEIPVVSHEIGQYCIYPDFNEISHYTGVLKAENFAVFRERLAEKHLSAFAGDYFINSGALAVACYKDELETALRTPSLAGFQLLDIQDFPGQGTASVGILNTFMENKGLISATGWREFCSDAVLQAEFDSYIVRAGSIFSFTASLAYYREKPLKDVVLAVSLKNESTGEVIAGFEHSCPPVTEPGRHIFGEHTVEIPKSSESGAEELLLTVSIKDTDIKNRYTLWSYGVPDTSITAPSTRILTESASGPAIRISEKTKNKPQPDFCIAYSVREIPALAASYSKILLFLPEEENTASIAGTYCTDFWCFPMFRGISESMGKEIPVGTLGLLIQNEHPALAGFPCKTYSTPQWFHIVNASRSTILDDTEIVPIVQTIDNFERNHRLGLLYEVYLTDAGCSVLICTSNLPKLINEGHIEAQRLHQSLTDYLAGDSGRVPGELYSLSSGELSSLTKLYSFTKCTAIS